MEKTKAVKKAKISENIQTPKTCTQSSEFINYIIGDIQTNLYYYTIKDESILIFDKSNKVVSDVDNILPNVKHENISKIICPFIKKYHFGFDIKFACLDNEIGNPILYVFLMPFVSTDNYYIIKVGYTKDIIQRHNDLKKEFNVDEIYLIYAKQIN